MGADVRRARWVSSRRDPGGRDDAGPDLAGRLVWLALALAVLPIVTATASALLDGWLPSGDDAVIALRTDAVFTPATPLVGQASTVDQIGTGDLSVNHPGPLGYWLLAVPNELVRHHPSGVLVGAALVNALCVVGIGWVARRRGGPPLAMGTLLATAVLLLSLGSELLYDPWNPNAALLPFALLLFLVWSLTAGDLALAPLTVFVASLCAQLHIAYVPIVIVLTVWTVGGVVLARRRRGGSAVDGDEATGRGGAEVVARQGSDRRIALVTVAVGAVCWATVAFEQLFTPRGNLTALWGATRASSVPPIGWSAAAELLARGIGVPPFAARPNVDGDTVYRAFFAAPPTLSTITAVALLVVLVGAVVLAARRRQGEIVAAGGTALAAVLATTWSLSLLPGGSPSPYRLRPLWPVGMFVWVVAGWSVWLLVLRRRPTRTGAPPGIDPTRHRGVTRASAVPLVALLLMAVVAGAATRSESRFGVYSDEDTAAIEALRDDVVTAVPHEGQVLLVAQTIEPFAGQPMGLLREMTRQGVDARVSEALGGQYGVTDDLAADPDEVVATVTLVQGPLGDGETPGERIARWDGNSVDARRELADLRQRLIAAYGNGPVPLADEDDEPTMPLLGEPRNVDDLLEEYHRVAGDPAQLLDSRTWAALALSGRIVVPAGVADAGVRFAGLQLEVEQRLFTVYLDRS